MENIKSSSQHPYENVEKKRRQLKCVNRHCKDGSQLVYDIEKACHSSHIKLKYKSRKQLICQTCLLICLEHSKKLMEKTNSFMKAKFPNFQKHLVIVSSSEDELEMQSRDTVSDLSTEKKTFDCLEIVTGSVLNKNNAKQLELNDDHNMLKPFQLAKERDMTIDEMKKIVYDPYNKPSSVTRTINVPMKDNKVVKFKLPNDIPKPRSLIEHICNHSCVAWTHYDYSKTRYINVLRIPLHFGFRRIVDGNDTNNILRVSRTLKEKKRVSYICPCGHTAKSIEDMFRYLIATKNKMTINMFDFSSLVDPLNKFKVLNSVILLKDLSYGQEFKPITCVYTMSNQRPSPPRMSYNTSRLPMADVKMNTDPNFLCGCDCIDSCQDKLKCACWQQTIKNQKIIPIKANQYNPNIGYNYWRLPNHVITGIYECNSTCKCSRTCLNRVVQQPLAHHLQVFRTINKGWGVRCLNDIPSGSFVCTYVGELLTENYANQGGLNFEDEYLAELDYIEVVEKTKESYEKNVLFSDDDYQAPYEINSSRRKSKGNRTKNPKRPKSARSYFGEDHPYILDAKYSGNIGRYINHSCRPNLIVQNVFIDTHDIRFPWISFFASHFIPAGKELTWDYSYVVGSVPGKSIMCYCGSKKCRKKLL